MNIVLFGDSHLARMDKSYFDYLEQHIDGAVVYNCATGGHTSIDGAKRALYIASLKPEVVVFSFGGNDVSPWKVVTPKEQFLNNMQAIFSAFPYSKKMLFLSPDVAVENAEQTAEYNTRIHDYRNSLNTEGIEVINANQLVDSLGGDYHIEDGVHMNNDAYTLLLEKLVATINSRQQ